MPLTYLFLIIAGLSLLAFYFNSLHGKDAPFVPMDTDVVERVMQIADVKKGDVFYDLGSGDGRLVIAAALHGAIATGIEIEPFKVFYSRLWIKFLRLKNAKIVKGDVFLQDLSDATVINLYLLPETHEKLKEKFKKELKKGTKIVAVGFRIEGWKHELVDPRGTIYGPIYLYKL